MRRSQLHKGGFCCLPPLLEPPGLCYNETITCRKRRGDRMILLVVDTRSALTRMNETSASR